MGSLQRRLDEWQRAGLIDAATAANIAAYEEAQAAGEPTERPGFLEAMVYLGLAIVGVGVIVLAATNWGHLGSWVRVLVPGIPAVLALAVGEVMRKQPLPGIRRGGSAAWFAAVALIAGTAAVIMNEAGARGEDGALVAALAAIAAALVLWQREPRSLQVAAGAGAALLLSIALAAETGGRGNGDFAPLAGGGAMLILGGLAVLATEAGRIYPRDVCRAFAGLALAFGGFFASVGDPGTALPEALPLVAGAALIFLGIGRGFFAYIGLGVAAIFAGTIELVLRHVNDPTIAAFALMLLGGALIGVVFFLATARPWQCGSGETPGLGSPAPSP